MPLALAQARPLALTSSELAALIDISTVQAFHGADDVRALAAVASANNFVAAHVLPNFVPLLRSLLPREGRTLAAGPVGFPSGGHVTAIKVAEARQLVADGAQELDMMINVGRLKSADFDYVRDDIRAVVEAIAPLPLKVILEIGYLSDDEIKRGCEIVAGSGAAFVKTGTGWTPHATTIDKIALITSFVAGAVEVKASGGIRTLDTVAAMIGLGVTRFGINAQVAADLIRQCAALPGGVLRVEQQAA